MPSSDSEDFESADEGQNEITKKERKKPLSSSNYSDNTLETQSDTKQHPISCNVSDKSSKNQNKIDGWDDFDIDDSATIGTLVSMEKTQVKELSVPKNDNTSQDTGWDDFDEWGQDTEDSTQKPQIKTPIAQEIKSVTEKLASMSNQQVTQQPTTAGWGWGWSVDSFLSTATAGISTITSQVSQGISTVLETSIGAPDPEELARKSSKDVENNPDITQNPSVTAEKSHSSVVESGDADASFQFGNLLSGVTKFVESTGTKVIAGGLDTLETIGKKTMEVLQDGDPGLAKKRAMLGLDPQEKVVLSQVLREAKAKAEEDDKMREEKREAKEVHYERLFDDFEGLVHLEALEMLSRQVSMRIDERLRSVDPDKRQDIKETLQQVAELCEMPEEEDDDDTDEKGTKPDILLEKLQNSVTDIGFKLQFQPLIKQYTQVLDSIATSETEKAIYKQAVSTLAQATALSVELYHKTAEMLLVKTRRSTADEADALTQLTVVLTKHLSDLATLFTERLNSINTDNKEQVNTYITNIFLEAGNSSTYIQNAFQLALPILQIGAV